jgi:hypothetical protein
VDRVVLAVHGKKSDSVAGDGGHDHFAGRDQYFLIRERDIFSLFDCFVSGGETDNPNRGGDDRLDVGVSGDALDAFRAEKNFELVAGALVVQKSAKPASRFFGSDSNNLWMVPRDLFGDERNVGAGGKSDNFEAARKRIDYAQALPADRAGTTKNRDMFHVRAILYEIRGIMRTRDSRDALCDSRPGKNGEDGEPEKSFSSLEKNAFAD